MVLGLIRRLRFWATAPRIGPDMPLTHWMLYFPSLAARLGRRRLLHFGPGAQIRPHVYMVETRSIHLGARVVLRPNTDRGGVPARQIKVIGGARNG